MGILDQVIQLRNQGMDDSSIIANLQEQGINPKAINDALSQAHIKNAIYDEGTQTSSGMYAPSTQEMAPVNQDYYAGQEYAAPQQNYGYSAMPAASGTDTTIEIAEQVFEEKIQKIQAQLDKLNEFQTLAKTKIDTTAERVKKIESTIDQLQAAILKKVGSYGGTLESIKSEMSMMQDSFNKVLNKR